MRILLIGSGGREHALAWKLSQSPLLSQLYAAPGSDAIAMLATCVVLPDNQAICQFAVEQKIDLVVVGPEMWLVNGLVDALAAQQITVFGPTMAAARLEGSKSFAKSFMAEHHIPTADYQVVETIDMGKQWIAEHSPPYVIKADGLAAGKGVVICHERAEAHKVLGSMLEHKRWGDAGARVVLESFLEGQEVTILVITDGERYALCPAIQDHKAAYDGDRGPNTGGMGVFAPVPFMDEALLKKVKKDIIEPTLEGMRKAGTPYCGVLYLGLMVQGDSLSMIEYNCRFGDPECQPLMMLLESDLLPALHGAAIGQLDANQLCWREAYAACVIMAAEGYPDTYRKQDQMIGLISSSGQLGLSTEPSTHSAADSDDTIAAASGVAVGQAELLSNIQIFHAGTCLVASSHQTEKQWHTNGGRVLGVTAMGNTLALALQSAYEGVKQISWQGCHYRQDIGHKGLSASSKAE